MTREEKNKQYCIKFIENFFKFSMKKKEKIIKKTKRCGGQGAYEFSRFLEEIKDVYDPDTQYKILEELSDADWK